MVHRLSRLRRREDGAVTTIAVLLISMVFIGLCALVVDLGMARDTRRQAQNAADASALAAGNVLYLTGVANIAGATAAAKSYALSNYGVPPGDWAGCTDGSKLAHSPDTPCISFNNASIPTAVRVNIPVRQVSTPFAQIWGVSTVPVSAAARINLVAGPAECGLCLVGSGSHDLQNGEISITGADVAINGSLSAGPNGSITVISVSGGSIDLQGNLANVHNNTDFTPAPTLNQPPVPDPLASLSMPDYSALSIPGATVNSCPGVPGIYDRLVACGGAGMTPGLYVLTGTTAMSGNEVIVANGVTLYLLCGTPAAPAACAAGQSGGSLQMTGNAVLSITAPTSGPTPGTTQGTKGLAIVADRNNTATHTFRGNGTQANSGTIYALSGTLDMRGNGAVNNTDSLVVVKDLSFSGSNAAFQSSYTQAANVEIPASNMHLSE